MVNRLAVELGPITADNIEHLRQINGASFPIVYNQSFYKDILHQDKPLNQFAYYKGQCVGAICAAFVQSDTEETKQRGSVYIRTLAVLAAYRGRGIGSQLMDAVVQYCDSHASVSEISLHVHVSNQDAMDFYMQRFGFTKGELVPHYYRRMDPPHCYRLYKSIMKKELYDNGE